MKSGFLRRRRGEADEIPAFPAAGGEKQIKFRLPPPQAGRTKKLRIVLEEL